MAGFNYELSVKLYNALAQKMPRKTGKMIDISLNSNAISHRGDSVSVFRIGNTAAEKYVPYYHILEDARRISYPKRGTSKTKGKQRYIRELGERDYSSANYRREIRFTSKDQAKNIADRAEYVANSFENKNYHYIEKIIDEVANEFAHSHNMKLKINRRSK